MRQPESPRNSTCCQQGGQKLSSVSTTVAHEGQRGGSTKSSKAVHSALSHFIARLSRARARRTSGRMPGLFDPRLRQLRRDRAARSGPALFLFERAFDDCLERLEMTGERFGEALLLGCPDPSWPGRLAPIAERVMVADPGPLFAARAGGQCAAEEQLDIEPGSLDLVLAIGTLDTTAALPDALLRLALALRPGGFLLGAISGGDTLPRLRAAMRAADEVAGGHSAHVHPRIEAAALADLLGQCGLGHAVVDVDRVQVRYATFDRLIADLRAMGATSLLTDRAPPLSKAARAAAAAAFNAAPVETFELLHFAARRG